MRGLDYQDKLARFLENHDEPRAAATFPPGMHEAAAIITFLSPGLRFFHQGQFEGRTEAHLAAPGTCARRGTNRRDVQDFYERLLAVLRQAAVRDGQWRLARVRAGMGRQLDVGLFPRVDVERHRWASDCLWPSTTPRIRASAMFACQPFAVGSSHSGIEWVR